MYRLASREPAADEIPAFIRQLWRLSACLGLKVSMSGYFLNESKAVFLGPVHRRPIMQFTEGIHPACSSSVAKYLAGREVVAIVCQLFVPVHLLQDKFLARHTGVIRLP